MDVAGADRPVLKRLSRRRTQPSHGLKNATDDGSPGLFISALIRFAAEPRFGGAVRIVTAVWWRLTGQFRHLEAG